jgi:hypothetical protein
MRAIERESMPLLLLLGSPSRNLFKKLYIVEETRGEEATTTNNISSL